MTIQQDQQLIRSAIQNLRWETDPEWEDKFIEIKSAIRKYWHDYK